MQSESIEEVDDTLSSIRPSDATATKDEMSFLIARNPSILAYSQRPFPSQDAKKQLMPLFEFNESPSDLHHQTVKVYLRMKPYPQKIKLSKEQENAYEIINPTTLLTRLPVVDQNMSNRHKTDSMVCRKFMFTQTFGPGTTQLELFEGTVQKQVLDFLSGQNSTIMTYGTTNSGKTFTLLGTTSSPGIIPRSLECVFSNISPRAIPFYKPVNHCGVVHLNSHERAQELECKTKLLAFGCSTEKSQLVNSYKQMQKLLQEESQTRESQCPSAQYSVWVSFAEIYNETIYDLLTNECQKNRTPLKLVTDSLGRTFIKGLKSICVSSGVEAYQVLMAGQYNLKVAATALNARSSRSHCIFTIKLLKYYTENAPKEVEVSTFSFCDLAGSERLKKTLNVGDRLKEAQNINTSLLVLGRCLKSIYEGQVNVKQKHDLVGPFRESKLTRLFQRALSGKEHIALIVNVNPIPHLYIETQNVLNFSAIAKRIVVEPKQKRSRITTNSRFSQIVSQSIKSVTDWENSELQSVGNTTESSKGVIEDTTDFIDPEDYEQLLAENEELKRENKKLKNAQLRLDLQIREDLNKYYTNIINELEKDYRDRMENVEREQEDYLEWHMKRLEDYYKQKLNEKSPNKRKRKRENESDNDTEEDEESISELQKENTRLRSKVTTLKEKLKNLRESEESLCTEKNKISFELALAKKEASTFKDLLESMQKDMCNDENITNYIEELKAKLLVQHEHIANLKKFLNEAKEEYIAITNDASRMEKIINEQEETIKEHVEKIADLEEELEQTMICLAEKTKLVESLEEKLESQNEKNKASNSLSAASFLKTVTNTLDPSADYQEIIIKQEVETCIDETIDKTMNENGDGEKEIKEKEKEEEEEEKEKEEEEEEEEKKNDVEDKVQLDLKNENFALKEKLTKSECEIDDLKNEIQQTKKILCSVTERLETYTREIEKKDKDIQVQISETEQMCQTSFVDEKGSADHSIQTDEVPADENLEDMKKELESARSRVESAEEENRHLTTVSEEHKLLIDKLEKEISETKDKKSIENLHIKDELSQRIHELEEESLKDRKQLQDRIQNLEESLENYEKDNKELKNEIEQYKDSLKLMEYEMNQVVQRDHDKEIEIQELQKNIKTMIQTTTNQMDVKMEIEMKSLVKETAELKEKVSEQTKELYGKDDEIHDLKRQVESFQQNMKILELVRGTAEDKQKENDRLKTVIEETKNLLNTRENEMETFVKHRDETVSKYENLVKSLQEDVEREKREVMRFQELFRRQAVSTPNKEEARKFKTLYEEALEELRKYKGSRKDDYNSAVSEDEIQITEKRPIRRRGRKKGSPVSQCDEIPVVELSGSESKRNEGFAVPTADTTEKRRRRKKLFVANDDVCVELEPSEIPPPPIPSPGTLTRSLRSRRK